MSFAVKKEKCMGCKTLLSEKDIAAAGGNSASPLCMSCKPRESEIYLSKLGEVNTHQETFNKLWTECQRCQGSFHQDVICSNRDCPIFYKRKKIQMDLQSVQEQLDKFSW